jgi:predicted nucleic acid-binding protein
VNFWDASALVRCANAREPGHARAINLLRQPVRQIASVFLRTECVAAISRALRHDASARREHLRWLEVQLRRFALIEVSPEILDRANALAAKHFLRAGDSLHLATALDLAGPTGRKKFTLVTCDEEQATAAVKEGMRIVRPDS